MIRFFHAHQSFLLIGHQDPDADCIGSQLALGTFLSRWGKKVGQFNQGPFKRGEINAYQPLFRQRIDGFARMDNPAVVVLDCSTMDRLGELSADIAGLPLAVIDHHASGIPFGDVRYVEPQRASTTWLVDQVIRALGGVPTAEEAHYLLLGLCTDTGFFRHCELGSEQVFTTAASLVECGASPKAVFQQINGGRKLANQRLMGLILSRTEEYFQGKVLLSFERLADRDQFQAENRESDTIYQVLQSVSQNEVVVLIRQDSPTTCTVGLRSKSVVDVGALAQEFGGGGHVRASGFSFEAQLDDLKKQLLEKLAKILM